jgi:hypothetical protein
MLMRGKRMRANGQDFLKPVFGRVNQSLQRADSNESPTEVISMVRPGVVRKISPEDVINHDKQHPWVRLCYPLVPMSLNQYILISSLSTEKYMTQLLT